MVHEAARQTMAEVRRQRREAIRAVTGRGPMPAISGVDAPPSDLRLSANYFRLVRTQWQPRFFTPQPKRNHVKGISVAYYHVYVIHSAHEEA